MDPYLDEFELEFQDFLVGVVHVEAFASDSAWGSSYSPVQRLDRVMIDHKTRLVRTPTGEDKQSSTQVYLSLSRADLFPLESRVTLDTGEVRSVGAVDRLPAIPGLPQHAVVYLT